jgi:hypothetical protein
MALEFHLVALCTALSSACAAPSGEEDAVEDDHDGPRDPANGLLAGRAQRPTTRSSVMSSWLRTTRMMLSHSEGVSCKRVIMATRVLCSSD